jgi:hypothetical protein
MEKSTDTIKYESPRIEDHGDLAELTAAHHEYGKFDANYTSGENIPSGGAGTSSTP